ncbi:MAG: dioxygenase family protein [Acidimicrobiales bacterium]
MSRRGALCALGAMGGGLLLAACGTGSNRGSGGNGDRPAGQPTTADPVRPMASTDLAGAFDQATSCSVTTELTEGPYYVDYETLRRDLREDREGEPLRLGIRVLNRQCQPVPGALVEVWHCDATGLYSAFEAASAAAGGGPGGGSARQGGRIPPAGGGSDQTRYLRGGQLADGSGVTEFLTVYPGWYPGRTPHIHTKVRVSGREMISSQLFFDDDVSTEVYESPSYSRRNRRTTFNTNDGFFDPQLVMSTTRDDSGYLSLVTLVMG